MPRVVFVPGFTQTASSWSDVRAIVDESCETLAVDVPVRDTFAATAHAIGARGRRGVYVGYSMGGRLCLRLALDYPELVRALVLVSMSPGIPDEAARTARIASDEKLARSVERDGVEAFLETWLAQPMFATVPPTAAGLADRRLLSPTYVAHCLRVLGAGTMEPMWSQLGELSMPIALVTGTLDARYEAVALQMLERLTGAVTHVRLDGGHALPLEQPAVLGGFVAAFAAQHG
ncbi:MAG TPA: alpha/beta fold hydrolase [Acidimicrobiia bacterium]|nr:alpha/beta fold hydrolase [Acidimicrobiia bacterium]